MCELQSEAGLSREIDHVPNVQVLAVPQVAAEGIAFHETADNETPFIEFAGADDLGNVVVLEALRRTRLREQLLADFVGVGIIAGPVGADADGKAARSVEGLEARTRFGFAQRSEFEMPNGLERFENFLNHVAVARQGGGSPYPGRIFVGLGEMYSESTDRGSYACHTRKTLKVPCWVLYRR